MGLIDKIRNDSRERQVREREALQRETQRQERELEDRRREEREHDRMASVDSAARVRGADPADAVARAVPDGHAQARHQAERPAGRLDDAAVQDAVELVRRERPATGTDTRAADAHSGAGVAAMHARPRSSDGQELAALFHADVAQDFRARWDAAQIGFVDDPRQAVQRADELVAEVMTSLTQSFADERRQLEAQMNDTASTENLRVALQRYRSFFHRLLSL